MQVIKKVIASNQKAIDALSDQVQFLMNAVKTLSNPFDVALLNAAILGDIIKAKSAINLGANINAQDAQLDTALHKACYTNQTQMVKFLLENGCDTSKKNITGKTALEVTENMEIAKLFSEYQQPKFGNVSSIVGGNPTLFAKSNFGSKITNEHENNYQQTLRKTAS